MGPVGPADAYVFTAEPSGVLRTSNFRTKVWLPAVRAAGLEPLRPHELRHTAVALWIAAGANPKEVAVRAGHTSVSFTLDRCGHLFEGHDAELRDRLDAMHAVGLQGAAEGRSWSSNRGLFGPSAGPMRARASRPNEKPGGIPGLTGADGGAPPGTRTPNRCLKRAGRPVLGPAAIVWHAL
jgi:hypothetical protein